MTQEHPITPPPELLRRLSKEAPRCRDQVVMTIEEWVAQEVARDGWIATKAFQAGADQQLQLDAEQINQAWQKGADQELEACIKWIRERPCTWTVEQLRDARRPKPKSQAEEAIKALDSVASDLAHIGEECTGDIIRAALERLRELEGGNG